MGATSNALLTRVNGARECFLHAPASAHPIVYASQRDTQSTSVLAHGSLDPVQLDQGRVGPRSVRTAELGTVQAPTDGIFAASHTRLGLDVHLDPLAHCLDPNLGNVALDLWRGIQRIPNIPLSTPLVAAPAMDGSGHTHATASSHGTWCAVADPS